MRWGLLRAYVTLLDEKPVVVPIGVLVPPIGFVVWGVKLWPAVVAIARDGLGAKVTITGNRGSTGWPALFLVLWYLALALPYLTAVALLVPWRTGALGCFLERHERGAGHG